MNDLTPTTDFYQIHQISPPSLLFDSLTDSFYFAKNTSGQFVYANQLLNEQFQLNGPSDVIGKTDFDFFSPQIAKQIRQDDVNVMENNVVISNKLELVEDKDGRMRWLFTTKSPLLDRTGKIVGVEGISRDAQKTQSNFEPYNVFRSAVEYLQANYHQKLSIKKLAELAYMSVSSFERKFKKVFGLTPSVYIKRYRIQRACQMLETGYSIQHTAHTAGFCDQSYFTREFRHVMGMTPRQFQQQMQ